MRKINHIGIATPNIEEIKTFYKNILGLDLLAEETIDDQKVKIVIFKCDESLIELLEPTDENSPIAKYLIKRGSGIHHIAFEVDNIENKLSELKSKGIKLIDEKPRIGYNGHKIAFIHPKDTGGTLIELVEINPPIEKT